MRRAVTTVCLTGILLIAGCSGPPDPPQPSISSVSTTPTPSTSPTLEIDPDQRFSLDDTAQFDDGLEVEIAGASGGGETEAGEPLPASTVIASVRIENNTTTAYDPRHAMITATYDGTPARPVGTASDGLTGTFTEVIEVADEGVAAAAFAIPVAEQTRVQFVVDLHDDDHDPISFTGRVGRG